MRMMVVFEKAYRLRHIGHLDLMRTMQRALRRSGLPVRYSKGYNPHIRMSFASPLSVGIAGEREIMDVAVEEETGADSFAATLNRAMPDGLRIACARVIDDRFPALMRLAAGSRYRIETECGPASLRSAIEKLLAAGEYVAVRKTKSGEAPCDILPFIESLETGVNALFFAARNLQGGSLKPSVLMNALFAVSGMEPCEYAVTREAILAKDAQNRYVPLEVISNG